MAIYTATPRDKREWDTTGEVMERLVCSIGEVHVLIRNGTLRATQLHPGGSWRVNRQDVEELAARMERGLTGKNGASS